MDNRYDHNIALAIEDAYKNAYKLGYERGHDIGYNEGYIAGISYCNDMLSKHMLNRDKEVYQ